MIILSIPYHGPESLTAIPEADIIEYRLDYCPEPDAIDYSVFSENNILTFRGNDGHPHIIHKMLASKAMVDLDSSELKSIDTATYRDKLIVSLHLRRYDESALRQLLTLECRTVKIIFEAECFSEIAAASRLIASSGRKSVIFNVNGKWVAFQRSLYRHFASEAVYLYRDQSTYPGQLSLLDFRLIHRTGIHCGAKVYGIFGGEGVNRSYSLKAYNELFLQQYLHAHYLPIPVTDPSEAIEVLGWLAERFCLEGFSITSPFKQSLPAAMGLKNVTVNSLVLSPTPKPGFSYSPVTGQYIKYANTDLVALRTCINELRVSPDDRILIYGSGACAQAFIQKLKVLGYSKIYLAGRNAQKVSTMRQSYLQPTTCHLPPATIPSKVELLINCSARLDFPDEPGVLLPHFDQLIELPYHPEQSSSLVSYCRQRDIPCVSGYDFFLKQWEAQSEFFGVTQQI